MGMKDVQIYDFKNKKLRELFDHVSQYRYMSSNRAELETGL